MPVSPPFLMELPHFPGGDDRYRSCRDAALFYAIYESLPVFPVQGKIPYKGTRGFKEATVDPAIIQAWWRRWPEANVAVPTGPRSGWLVLDIDERHEGFASLRMLSAMARHRAADLHRAYEPLSETRTAKTGGGLHLIYAYPSDLEIKSTVELAGLPGLDLRAKDGYIVVPPSLHPSGVRYGWLAEEDPAPLPQLLLDAIGVKQLCIEEESQLYAWKPSGQLARPFVRNSPDYFLKKAIEKAHVGTRHTYALFLACRLIEDVGLTLEEAEAYMRTYVQSVPGGEDYYELDDALRCLQWAVEHL